MNGGLEIPGQLRMGVQFHDGPNARPQAVNLQNGNQMQLHAFGGFTKLEYAAIEIAAGGAKPNASQAVTLAAAVLAECEKRQRKPAEPAAGPAGLPPPPPV